MLFLDHGNWLSAIIGMAFVNILKAQNFLCCFRNLQALQTSPLYPILHIVRISKRGMKTCTSEKPDLSFSSSSHRQSWWVFEILVAEIYIMLGGLDVTVRVRDLKFELWSKSTDSSKHFLAIQCNLDLHFHRILCWRRILYIDLNYVKGKCGFLKKATRLPRRQSLPQWRTVGLGNKQTNALSIPSETLDLSNNR